MQTSDPGPVRPGHPLALPCPSALAFPYRPRPTVTFSTWRCPAPLLPVPQFCLYPQVLFGAAGPEPHPSGCSLGSAPIYAKACPYFGGFPTPTGERPVPLLCGTQLHGLTYLSSPRLYIPPSVLNTLATYLSPKQASQVHTSMFYSCCSLCLKCYLPTSTPGFSILLFKFQIRRPPPSMIHPWPLHTYQL